MAVVTAFLVASLFAAGLFHLILYRKHNAAPTVDLTGYDVSGGGDMQAGLDQCSATDGRIAVRGWVARRNKGSIRRNVEVVVLPRNGTGAYAANTRLEQRDDVSALLNRRFSDDIDYRFAGFAASLAIDGRADLRGGRLFVAYDDGSSRVLLPLACDLAWPP